MMTLAAETDVQDEQIQIDGDEQTNVEQVADEQPADQQTEGTQAAADEDDSVVVTIGEDSPASEEDEHRAPEWVRELRKANREKDKRIRELEQAQAERQAEQTSGAVKLGEKPTLDGCDYDAERFEAELAAWHERKRDVEQQEAKKREAIEAEQKAWTDKLHAYGKSKTELKVRDFEDAEEAVLGTLNVTQQGVILHGAENPALLVYALGKNPKKAKELASISDPVKFAFAVAKLETQLKVTPRKAAPAPEKTVRGSAPVSGSVDSTLERLRAEAAKTGDFTKVHQYRRQQREKQ